MTSLDSLLIICTQVVGAPVAEFDLRPTTSCDTVTLLAVENVKQSFKTKFIKRSYAYKPGLQRVSPHDAIRGIRYGPVSVCLSVCHSRCSVKSGRRMIAW